MSSWLGSRRGSSSLDLDGDSDVDEDDLDVDEDDLDVDEDDLDVNSLRMSSWSGLVRLTNSA